jgi:hypothetical protein
MTAEEIINILLEMEPEDSSYAHILNHIRATDPHTVYARMAEPHTDWSRWSWPMLPVRISVFDPKLPADVEPASQRDVKRYARMKSPIPAIVLLDYGDRYGVADGRHRLAAARIRGDTHVLCYIGVPLPSRRSG